MVGKDTTKMKSGIYGIRNMIDGKWYIGQSTDIDNRKQRHFCALKGGYHFNKHLQMSFIKYGINNFEFRILEETPESMLDIRERAWITYFESRNDKKGYNFEDGGNLNKHLSILTRRKMSEAAKGNQNSKGFHPSIERRKEISEALKKRIIVKGHPALGHYCSTEARLKIGNANKGRYFSKKMRCKMSEVHKGHKCFDETRRKMSIAQKGKPWSMARRLAQKKIKANVPFWDKREKYVERKMP